jgi:glycosyltransferase involved in cell wall biosynthesis
MINNDLISIIIPTYNRFKFLLNTLKSVKQQSYKNIEIIVINDGSSEKEYYEYNWEENGIIIINLETNSKEKFGYGCVGYVRNEGIKKSSGKYIAFCDDDDIWLPDKLEKQIVALKESDCKMCCTDGYIGTGEYDEKKKYKKYNAEHCYKAIKNKYVQKNSDLLNNGFPKIWNLEFLKIHNCVINSSVLIEKSILDIINGVPLKRRGQDYLCWLNALKYTNIIYLDDLYFYIDRKHGNGSNH